MRMDMPMPKDAANHQLNTQDMQNEFNTLQTFKL